MKQERLSMYLKLADLAMAVVGIFFFGGLIYHTAIHGNPAYLQQSYPSWLFILFKVIVAVICYGVLYEFYGVAKEIGRDNSFSVENVRHFQRMFFLAVAGCVIYLVRSIAVLSVMHLAGLRPTLSYAGDAIPQDAIASAYLGISLILCFAFLILSIFCKALAGLVDNAAQIKAENDLTI